MLVHARTDASNVNGPGRRAVVFVQGCRLGCQGCWNPRTHALAGDKRGVDELARWIVHCRESSGISGLTFSGGEPMHQAPELLALAQKVRAAIPDLSFGMFSGYSERELDDGSYWTLAETDADLRRSVWQELRLHLDFAVLGRYNDQQRTAEPLRTSRNQVLRHYSPRYTEADFGPPEIEVTIESQLVSLTGFPLAGLPV
ncbi:MAG: radical SAM protein [Bryobacteraceae bacterium]|nr:radical SAM protein [Bryobacteraceae bacterium]